MSQRRYAVTGLMEFPIARLEKLKLQDENPGKRYQIRKYKNGCRVMERLTTNEAQVIGEMRQRGKKRKPGFTVL